jgi:flagellar FliL protein
MATPQVDPPRTGDAKASENGEAAAAPAPAAGGGFKAFLPLIVAVVVMPALAFATTRFVLLPKLTAAVSPAKAGAATAEPAAPAAAEGGASAAKEGGKTAGGKAKVTVALSKILVNVAGTMGTRYLMTSVTLVGTTPDFKEKIDDNHDQLMDLANGALSTKTISDLEKPGARNVIRTELLTVFNNALGGPLVQEIYITELAIQ